MTKEEADKFIKEHSKSVMCNDGVMRDVPIIENGEELSLLEEALAVVGRSFVVSEKPLYDGSKLIK